MEFIMHPTHFIYCLFLGDVTTFDTEEFHNAFDRIISIEMFEHMKNYDLLLKKISTWLKNEGKLFVHIFTHRWKPYHFTDDWMARTFFTGGTMPSHSLLLNFQTDLQLTDQWGVSGTHYEKTLNIWLDKLDQNLDVILPIMKTTYGDKVRKPKLYIYHIYYDNPKSRYLITLPMPSS